MTSAGSWYRHENSNRSDTSSTHAPEAKQSRLARASDRAAGSERQRLRSRARAPASPATVHRASTGPGVYPPLSW